MNLDLKIEKGGIGDKLAEGLKESANEIKHTFDDVSVNMDGAAENLKEGLTESTTLFAQDKVDSVVTGAANVVAAAGINIGTGSTDQIIADNISAAINLTGEEGLTNMVNNLEGYTQQLTEMGLNAPEELVEIILSEIEKLLEEGGVIDVIKAGMQATQTTVDMAKTGLQYATSAATVLANLQKLLTQLNKMQNVDVMCVPSVKDSMNALTASLIEQIKAQYYALKQQLIIFYNSMICTSNDSTLDNVIVSANNILEVIEPAIDPVLQQYTGHTIAEVRNICNQGFAYIGMIERAAAKKRKEKEEAEQNEENVQTLDETETE